MPLRLMLMQYEINVDARVPLVAQTVESACNAGDPGLIPELGRSPGEGNGNLLQYSYLENYTYRLWGHKESHTAERLILSFFQGASVF